MTRLSRLGHRLILAVLLATLACATPALADWIITDTQGYIYPAPLPSFTGDIVVEATGSLSLTGYDLPLAGSVVVHGSLTLDGCALRFAPTGWGQTGVQNYGQVEATGTHFVSTTEYAAVVKGFAASINSFLSQDGTRGTGCLFSGVCLCVTDNSASRFEYATFSRGIPDYGQLVCGGASNTFINCLFEIVRANFRESSVNELTGCIASPGEFDFYGSSVNSVSDCDLSQDSSAWCMETSQTTFTDSPTKYMVFVSPSRTTFRSTTTAPVPIAIAKLIALDDTSLTLSPATSTDLRPGIQNRTIAADNNPFSVTFLNADVQRFAAAAAGEAQLTASDCQMELSCCEAPQVSLNDCSLSQFEVFTYYPSRWWSLGGYPINVTVRGLIADGTPQTTNAGLGQAVIASDNTPFHVTLNNTTLTHASFYLGDNDSGVATANLVENSENVGVISTDDAVTTMRNCVGSAAVAVWPYTVHDAAQLLVEDSELSLLRVHGEHTRAVLSQVGSARQMVVGVVYIGYTPLGSDPVRVSSPALELHDASLREYIAVGEETIGATILGKAQMAPTYRVSSWAPDSTVIRQFPVLVQNDLALPVPGAAVWVTDAVGEVLWEGVTDGDGYAYPEITFDQYNYDTEFRVKAWYPGWYASAPVRFLSSTPLVLALTGNTLAFTSFEEARAPWTAFAAGAGQAVPWRALGATGDLPPAHSGDYLMAAEVSGEAITGLRLDLPVEPTGPIPSEYTLRTWLYPDSATANTSALVGFVLADECLTPTSTPTSVSWEALSPTSSRLWIGDTATDLVFGLSLDRWHLAQLKYDRVAQTATLWVNGLLVHEADTSAVAGQPVSYAALGARSAAGGAALTYFDDTSLTLGWPPDAPPPGECTHPYALLEGPEQMISGQEKAYTLTYGNGYPVLGVGSFPASAGQRLYVGVSLPTDYALVSATPAPTRMVANTPVWEFDPPEMGNEGQIALVWQTPEGLVSERTDRVVAWATTDPDAVTTDPPNPPNWLSPCDDSVWGCPEDLLPQWILADEPLEPDLWVRKSGPETASPGDTLGYLITVGNSGFAPAEDVVVKDRLPEAMGGGNVIVANLAELAPGDQWRGLKTALLPWGVPGGTLLLNRAYVPTGVPEMDYDNNTAEWTTTVQAAHDPNQITVSPTEGVQRGDTLTYIVECENEGLGTAYGVYVSAALDEKLDEGTLTLPEGVLYDPGSRTLMWEVGTLTSEQSASISFTVMVAGNARRARPVVGHATVYFPSVPEETPTNVVFNTVAGTFSDVAWDHWALLQVELAYENGVVGGYDDGTYRPAVQVDRGQMAVFIARSLAGGDGNVPSGPVSASFTDVLTTHWAFKYVEYAKAEGVVTGYPDGTYRPTQPVDRGQMAVYIARAVAGGDGAVPPAPETPTFTDVTPETSWAWAQKYVEYTVSRGVVAGYSDGTYRPAVVCTRDQMAVFVARAFALPM